MIKILNFKREEKGSRIGFVKFENEKEGRVYQGIPVFIKDGKRWVGMPSYKDETNEKYPYQSYFYYKDKTVQTKFLEAVNEAIGAYLSKDGPAKPLENNYDEGELPF